MLFDRGTDIAVAFQRPKRQNERESRRFVDLR